MTFGANAAVRISRVLQGRLPFGRGLLLQAQDRSVAFRPGEQVTMTDAGDGLLEIQIPPAVLRQLTHILRPIAGTYRLPSVPGLSVRIVKSQIRDREGTVVADIG